MQMNGMNLLAETRDQEFKVVLLSTVRLRPAREL